MDRHKVWILFDNLKRKYFLKYEIKRLLLRSIKRSTTLPYIRRYQASYYLSTMTRSSAGTYSSNRCVTSGRVWSVNKKTHYNRFILRTEIAKSNLPGFRRASW